MKKFFGKIKAWWQKHKPTKRRLIQLYAFLLYNCNIKGFGSGSIYTGNTKYMCVPGLNCYSCPGAVGACPLGALQNALASSGTRAGFYVFGIIILFGLLLGRTICGFLCPIGLGQELLYKIRTPKLKKSKVTRVLSYFKYVVLAVLVVMIPLMYGGILPVPGFCKYICPAGTFEGAIGLLINPANADLYTMLGVLFTWKFGVLIALCVASVFIYRVFCRFLCPLGAIYGFFSKVAMLGVKLDKNKCTDCGLCLSKCKMDIKRVGDHECIQCGECIDICPAHAISWKGSKLFVHENAVPAPSEEKPLASLMSAPAAAAAEGAQTPALGAETAVLNAETVAVGQIADDGAFAPVKENEGERRADRERKRNFWLQFAAWAAALALLLGAILYFNVFSDGGKPSEGTEVGNLCPEFTVSVYGGEDGETYSVTDTRGKVTVLNFWYTTCTPCVAEMPHFARVAEEYGETISVVAIHSTAVTENVEDFLAAKGWDKYGILFAQDHGTFAESETYLLLGGKRTFPMTLILDEEGVISYRVQGSVTYETLKAEIDKVIKYYNVSALKTAKVNIISVEELDAASHGFLPKGFHIYDTNPAPSANLTAREGKYYVFNNRIPMSWQELVQISELFTKSYAGNASPTNYGFFNEWWFSFGWSVGGDCLEWDEAKNQYVMALGEETKNYIVTGIEGASVNGTSYAEGELLSYSDKHYVADVLAGDKSDETVKHYTEGDEPVLYPLPSIRDAFTLFLQLSQRKDKAVTNDKNGLALSPTPNIIGNKSKKDLLTSREVAFVVENYTEAYNIGKGMAGQRLEWDIAPMYQYREFDDSGNLKKVNGTEIKGREATHSGTISYSIPANSKSKDGSWEFIEYMAGPEVQRLLMKSNFYVPNQMSIAYSDEYMNMTESYIANNKNAILSATACSSVGDWSYLEKGDWVTIWSKMLNGEVRNGEKTLEEFFADKCIADTNEALKDYRAKKYNG